MKRLFHLLCLSLLFFSCNTDDDVSEQPKLVVEGWIDSGGYPIVLLTATVPISEQGRDVKDLGDYVLRWAKVTVSDGEREVVLTGMLDKRYFPPYVYTTSRLRGEVGKTYRLTVSYSGLYAEAETFIPQPVPLDSIRVRPCEDSDTLYQIRAYFHDDPSQSAYYKFFTRIGRNQRMYLSSYIQTLDNSVFLSGEEIDVSVMRGRLITDRPNEYTPYFTEKDTVVVKFARMDSLSFLFWNQMEHNMTLSFLPVTAAKRNPQFNVKGGIGYWCGYGATFYPVVVGDSICRRR